MREVQNSIKDSVYKLLADRIEFYNLTDYKISETKIINTITGTSFIFKGLKEQNANNIKSLEGIDIVWLEEAQKISKKSWDILDPTIRKKGSEIWISMNREAENDPVWQALAINSDAKTLVVRVNYTDNPFCPEEMKYLAAKCRRENPEDYEHIWLGAPQTAGSNKLISCKSVRKATQTQLMSSSAPLIIGLDVARFGDDKTVFCLRKGRWCMEFKLFDGLDNVAVANQATHYICTLKPAKMFIDAGGLGAGVVDILNDRGFKKIVRGIMFGSKAINDDRYHNRRAEMWDELRQWLNSEPAVKIPNEERLCAELCAVGKKYDSRGRLQLEEKDEIKKRLGHSPDLADSLALTFAEPVYIGTIGKYAKIQENSIEDLFLAEMQKNKNNTW